MSNINDSYFHFFILFISTAIAMNTLGLMILVLFSLNIRISIGLSCKDESNNDVDWFVIYKLPQVLNDELLSKGSAYTFLTSNYSEEWSLSTYDIENEYSMLGRTWENMHMYNESVSYLFYNDNSPDGFETTSRVGHLKGYLAFDETSGYWLMHSIPKFGQISHYEYPKNGLMYGQYAFCVNYNTKMLNEICQHLLYCHPNIYLKKGTENVLSQLEDSSKSIFSDKPSFIRSPPFVKMSRLESVAGVKFLGYAKDNQFKEDLYSEIIAPRLKVSLMAETWRNGAGIILPPECKTNYTVTDIKSIELKATSKLGKKTFHFNSTDDHCKWSVSSAENYICFADLNRMKSQGKRGGGAICFQSESVSTNFRKSIADTEKCPITV